MEVSIIKTQELTGFETDSERLLQQSQRGIEILNRILNYRSSMSRCVSKCC